MQRYPGGDRDLAKEYGEGGRPERKRKRRYGDDHDRDQVHAGPRADYPPQDERGEVVGDQSRDEPPSGVPEAGSRQESCQCENNRYRPDRVSQTDSSDCCEGERRPIAETAQPEQAGYEALEVWWTPWIGPPAPCLP